MEKDFNGKTAIVTGAASGIGEAIAKELAARGANVVVADIALEPAQNIVDVIAADGGKAAPFAGDVSDPKIAEATVEFAKKTFGALHYAVNNAGIGGPNTPVGEHSIEGWQKVININLNGVFYGLRYQIPAIVEAGGGAIVNMASILGSVGFRTQAAYVAAKHGVVGLTKTAALEYAKANVRVNAVGPGFIRTPLVENGIDAPTLDFLKTLHAPGRLGTPEEVSALTCFLLSERASFITGSYHLVDGAFVAQ
jgi:NAD(P)-dependent dehydrogenase (short-subunit alcohol dehydrogenase family)